MSICGLKTARQLAISEGVTTAMAMLPVSGLTGDLAPLTAPRAVNSQLWLSREEPGPSGWAPSPGPAFQAQPHLVLIKFTFPCPCSKGRCARS